jgi:hypothetical protein
MTLKSRLDKLTKQFETLHPEFTLIVITSFDGQPTYRTIPTDQDKAKLEAAFAKSGRFPAAFWRGSVSATIGPSPLEDGQE